MNPTIWINDASIVPKDIWEYIEVITLPGNKTIGAKKIVIIINGSAVILLNSAFKVPLTVYAIIMKRKFKLIKASKLKPNALPNPILINLFLELYFQFK